LHVHESIEVSTITKIEVKSLKKHKLTWNNCTRFCR